MASPEQCGATLSLQSNVDRWFHDAQCLERELGHAAALPPTRLRAVALDMTPDRLAHVVRSHVTGAFLVMTVLGLLVRRTISIATRFAPMSCEHKTSASEDCRGLYDLSF
ncbi:unnamed protein product [Durusdinium trenchii]|uniref:Uncharacterized protein n=1 Tax=Durusdinium trenchii TaxID=1381693 RepID=A0ABP0L639_9DINO